MATSGTLQLNPNTYTTDGAPNRADINWSATWNSSTLQWSVSWNAVAAGNTNSYWVTIFSGTVTFTDANGNVLDTKSMAAQVPKARGGDQLLSGSFVVGVDSLGNQTLNISGRFQIEYNGSGSDNAGTSKGSGSYALDQMAMASTFTVTSTTVGASGGASTVSISRRSPSYTHSVTWKLGSYTHTETGVGTSVTYTIPASWLNAIPSSPNGVGSVTIQTYNGSTPIGGEVGPVQFSVTAAVYPSIGSFTSAPRGAAYTAQITNYTTTYVSGYSTALLTASSCSGAYGSSIKRYDFYQSGALIAQASSSASSYSYETVNPVSGSEIRFTVVVTDTRDRQTSANVSVSLRPYATPTFSSANAYRCNSSGTATNDGTYVKVEATAVATPSENSIVSLTFAEKPTTSNTWSNEISIASYPITGGYANTSSYDVRIKATDKLGQTSYRYFTIPTAEYTMDFKVGGKGVAFGKVAETDNLVDSKWNIKAPFFEGNRAFTRELTSADDLNNIKDFGWYYEPSAGATYMPANVPSGFTGAFTLEVYPATGNYVNSGAWVYITQRLKPFNTIQYYERFVYTDGNGAWYYGGWGLLPDDASATKGGYVNTIAQTFAGSKTFQEIINAQGFRGTSQNANAQTIIQPVGFVEYATIGAQDVLDTNTVTKLLQWITANYPTRTRETIFVGTLAAGSSHMFALMPYDTSIVSGGIPQYSVGIDITFNHTYLFGSFGYSPYLYTTY